MVWKISAKFFSKGGKGDGRGEGMMLRYMGEFGLGERCRATWGQGEASLGKKPLVEMRSPR